MGIKQKHTVQGGAKWWIMLPYGAWCMRTVRGACVSVSYMVSAYHACAKYCRVLLERLIVNRPHPWGLLITFIELVKNPRYAFVLEIIGIRIAAHTESEGESDVLQGLWKATRVGPVSRLLEPKCPTHVNPPPPSLSPAKLLTV